MPVELREVSNKKELKDFITFPFELYKNDPEWLPPFLSDEKKYFDPSKNANLKTNPYKLYLAYKDGLLAGRLMVLINQRANEHRNEKVLRWTFFDTIKDREVANALMNKAEEFGRRHGMELSIGPRGFSDEEPQGALVEGFDQKALIGTHYNRPYMIEYLSELGYVKDVDWVCYTMKVPEALPPIFMAMLERSITNKTLTCNNFKTKAELKPYIVPVFELLNRTYSKLYGFAPMTHEEMQQLANKYLPILDPRYVFVIKKEGDLVGFAVIMPDLTEGIKKARGRLLPFGLFHILKAAKKTDTLQFLLIGIDECYRGQGLFSMFALKLFKEIEKSHIKRVDSHLQLEQNQSINKWLERLNGKVFKRYRAFKKPL